MPTDLKRKKDLGETKNHKSHCIKCGKDIIIKDFKLTPCRYVFNKGYVCRDCIKRMQEEKAAARGKKIAVKELAEVEVVDLVDEVRDIETEQSLAEERKKMAIASRESGFPERKDYESDAEYFIDCALALKASDIHLNSNAFPVVRVAGELIVLEETAVKEEEIFYVLKKYTDVDVDAFVKSKKAENFCFSRGDVRVRGNVYKDNNGINMALRMLTIVTMDFAKLGIPEILKTLATKRSGLILVTGPTGSGKTTTLTCLLDYINKTQSAHILTIEDPIEFIHKNQCCIVTQREVGRDTESFDKAVTEAMREDPDIIMVGEMSTKESIQAAVRAAETGHLVLSTLHTRGTINSVSRIVDAFPADQQDQIRSQLAAALLGVVSQQLVPGTQPNTRCLATEVLVATSAVKAFIRENRLHMGASVLQTSRADGMHTMKNSLDNLLAEGKITQEMHDSFMI